MPTTTKKYHWLDAKEFKMLKALTDAGVTKAKINQVTNRSYGVIEKVQKCNNLKEYEELTKVVNAKYNHKTNGKAEPTATETSITREYEARYQQKLLNRLDTIISLLSKNQSVATYAS